MSQNHPSPSSTFDINIRQARVALPSGQLLFQLADWSVPTGAHLLINGPSGSGKTTLLHLIAGLFVPDYGRVCIGDHDLSAMTDDARCDLRRDSIGVVFQKLNLLEHLTIAENVALALRPAPKFFRGTDASPPSGAAPVAPRRTPAEICREAITHVQLAGRESERCSHLSLGEQQRVAVARVLAQAPQIILADEPTSSLDEKNANFVMQALKNSARGRTLIVVSHDQRLQPHFERVINFRELVR